MESTLLNNRMHEILTQKLPLASLERETNLQQINWRYSFYDYIFVSFNGNKKIITQNMQKI